MQKVSLYHSLLHDASRLKALWQLEGLDEFVALMRQYLDWPELNFEQLQRFLAEQNQQPFCPELASFSLCWQPYGYQAQRKIVRWVPAFLKPSLPFFEEDIALSRQSLLAQLVQHETRRWENTAAGHGAHAGADAGEVAFVVVDAAHHGQPRAQARGLVGAVEQEQLTPFYHSGTYQYRYPMILSFHQSSPGTSGCRSP